MKSQFKFVELTKWKKVLIEMGMILRKSNEDEIEKYEIYKHGNSNLFRRLDKDSIANQSTVSLVIGTGNICRDKMVCERLAGNKGILLKLQTDR